ncbi:oxalurate catabolism protein HpxZ [Leptolyngbya sp. FACHB-321]|uniref:oxalurate catabolism protein HpxZ n=1 Tax=Leptolyngbya sp. FACHB-321 TaxID=2692807 RepID=UPI001683A5CA|nr:oxalurate catabolism protein HpxZ [Leptolyngbya sp. FACHB-321]MBD2037397.1 oxalurate catabolism protein HpxZ [Leptolyngbya sp. FACHB-321]
MPQINDPAIVTELTALYLTYEKALVENDLATLDNLFWNSPDVLRFGVTENLYGMEAIKAFRQGRSTKNLERDISNLKVVTFDADTAIVTLEFQRLTDNVLRAGRQSQVWRKLPQGWKIVSAHVSLLPG